MYECNSFRNCTVSMQDGERTFWLRAIGRPRICEKYKLIFQILKKSNFTLHGYTLHHNTAFPTDMLVGKTAFADRKSVGNDYCRPKSRQKITMCRQSFGLDKKITMCRQSFGPDKKITMLVYLSTFHKYEKYLQSYFIDFLSNVGLIKLNSCLPRHIRLFPAQKKGASVLIISICCYIKPLC